MNEKRGISLIVLIITIIVIIILAGAVILSLNKTNIIGNANKAVSLQNKSNVIDAYNLLMMDKLLVEKTTGTPIVVTLEELAKKSGQEIVEFEKKFKLDENNNLQEKQNDGSYVTIAKFPVSMEVGKPAPRPSEWGKIVI